MKKQLLITTATLLGMGAFVAPAQAAPVDTIFPQTTQFASVIIKDLTWGQQKQVLALPQTKTLKLLQQSIKRAKKSLATLPQNDRLLWRAKLQQATIVAQQANNQRAVVSAIRAAQQQVTIIQTEVKQQKWSAKANVATKTLQMKLQFATNNVNTLRDYAWRKQLAKPLADLTRALAHAKHAETVLKLVESGQAKLQADQWSDAKNNAVTAEQLVVKSSIFKATLQQAVAKLSDAVAASQHVFTPVDRIDGRTFKKHITLQVDNGATMTVKDVTVDGDVYVTGANQGGTINLTNVTAKRIFVQNVDQHSLTTTNVKADELIVTDNNGAHIVANEGTTIATTRVSNEANNVLVETKNTTLPNVSIETTKVATINLNGSFTNVDLKAVTNLNVSAGVKLITVHDEAAIEAAKTALIDRIEFLKKKLTLSGNFEKTTIVVKAPEGTVDIQANTKVKALEKDSAAKATVNNYGYIELAKQEDVKNINSGSIGKPATTPVVTPPVVTPPVTPPVTNSKAEELKKAIDYAKGHLGEEPGQFLESFVHHAQFLATHIEALKKQGATEEQVKPLYEEAINLAKYGYVATKAQAATIADIDSTLGAIADFEWPEPLLRLIAKNELAQDLEEETSYYRVKLHNEFVEYAQLKTLTPNNNVTLANKEVVEKLADYYNVVGDDVENTMLNDLDGAQVDAIEDALDAPYKILHIKSDVTANELATLQKLMDEYTAQYRSFLPAPSEEQKQWLEKAKTINNTQSLIERLNFHQELRKRHLFTYVPVPQMHVLIDTQNQLSNMYGNIFDSFDRATEFAYSPTNIQKFYEAQLEFVKLSTANNSITPDLKVEFENTFLPFFKTQLEQATLDKEKQDDEHTRKLSKLYAYIRVYGLQRPTLPAALDEVSQLYAELKNDEFLSQESKQIIEVWLKADEIAKKIAAAQLKIGTNEGDFAKEYVQRSEYLLQSINVNEIELPVIQSILTEADDFITNGMYTNREMGALTTQTLEVWNSLKEKELSSGILAATITLANWAPSTQDPLVVKGVATAIDRFISATQQQPLESRKETTVFNMDEYKPLLETFEQGTTPRSVHNKTRLEFLLYAYTNSSPTFAYTQAEVIQLVDIITKWKKDYQRQ